MKISSWVMCMNELMNFWQLDSYSSGAMHAGSRQLALETWPGDSRYLLQALTQRLGRDRGCLRGRFEREMRSPEMQFGPWMDCCANSDAVTGFSASVTPTVVGNVKTVPCGKLAPLRLVEATGQKQLLARQWCSVERGRLRWLLAVVC